MLVHEGGQIIFFFGGGGGAGGRGGGGRGGQVGGGIRQGGCELRSEAFLLFFIIFSYLDLFQSLYDFFAEIRNYSIFFWLSLPVHSGSLKRIDYPKQLSGPPSFF